VAEPLLVGRSSSHYTRIPRLFAHELSVAHRFQPVFDLTSSEPNDYAGNPALKIPALVDEEGALYGCENIVRELTRRSGERARVVLRGDVADRIVANVEELTLHVMTTEVTLIMSQAAGATPPPKVRRSLALSLAFLDRALDGALARLPADRRLSFVETALFCTVTHLSFRQVADPTGHSALQAFCARFAQREAARQTEYRFDRPPTA